MSDVDIMLREARMEERNRVIDAVFTWIEIARKEGYDKPFVDFPSRADADHSALLVRLLDGDEPLPIPPPKAYSYPWYNLIEDGEGIAAEVWKATIAGMPPDYESDTFLMIEQSRWEIVEEISETEFIASYHDEGQQFMVVQDEMEASNGHQYWTLTAI